MDRKSEKYEECLMDYIKNYKVFIDGFIKLYKNLTYCYENYDDFKEKEVEYDKNMDFLQKHFPIRGVDWRKIYKLEDLLDDFQWTPGPNGWTRDFSRKVIDYVNRAKNIELSEKLLNAKIEESPIFYEKVYESFEICSKYFIKENERSAILKSIKDSLKRIDDDKSLLYDVYSKHDIIEFITNEKNIDSSFVELSLRMPFLIEISKISGCQYNYIKLRDEYIKSLKDSVTNSITQAKNEIRGVF